MLTAYLHYAIIISTNKKAGDTYQANTGTNQKRKVRELYHSSRKGERL